MAPVFSAVDVVATYPIDSSFNTSAATPASFSSFNMSADTPELISSINTSAAASVPIVLFYIIRPTPTCLAVDTDFDPVSAAEICEAMANPPPMVKKGSSAQIGQTDTTVQLSLSLLCAVICITYIREFKYTWVLHKQIQDFFTPPFDAWDKKPAVEATGNAKQVEYATVTAYIATAAQIAEPAAANKDELLDSDMIRIAQSDAPVLTAKHKRMFRGKMRAKLRSVDKAIKLAIKLKRAYHAK
ncbi:hypothetical protein GGH12_003468 [Coemansia sp. RSA 1822]|nr:hypothetical protein LPJ76_005652 [Coemansia sp. RSA 638]KAJ2119208.1 hypothetical protein IW147_006057 [Coemansia sp. RSA 720]KAJ2541945.1 hypothetical protein GGF49_003259 [Coemansia sp. RSA 1853]KAJ2562113.1 hypothetical protein GGH12_003468 [Coemansia sp. RSA 1822]